MSDDQQQYAVIVTRPDSPDRPDGADLVVRFGPYSTRWWAEHVIDELNATAHQRSRVDGTTLTVAEYDESLPHRSTLTGAGVDAVMEAIRAEPNVWAEWSFPDTWDILRTVYGHDTATLLHRRACDYIDAEGEAIEAQEREEQEAAERLRPCRDLIAHIRADHDGAVDDATAEQAAATLADVFDTIERRGVRAYCPTAGLAAAVFHTVAASNADRQPATTAV